MFHFNIKHWLLPLIVLTACSAQPDTTRTTPNTITAAASSAQQALQNLRNPNGSVMVVAHRACWRGSAENSLDAVNRCIAMGVDMVEIDVRRSADGVLVVMHDASVDRTTNGTGAVDSLTLDQLRSLRLRSELGGKHAALTDERVLTLEELLNHTRGKILVNVDAKSDVFDDVAALLDAKQLWDEVLVKGHFYPVMPPCSARFIVMRIGLCRF